MSPRVLMRADAHPAIGGGHLARCLALAAGLQRRGAMVAVACADVPGTPWQLVPSSIARLPLPADVAPASDADATLAAARAHWSAYPDVVVVDHYGLDARWERRIAQGGAQVLVIDDLADRDHECRWLLDQNLFAGGETVARDRYRERAGSNCVFLLGPRYALINQSIVAAAASPRVVASGKPRVFVAMGLADPTGATVRVIQALRALAGVELEADVVIGAANPRRDEIEAAAREDQRLKVQLQPRDYAERLAASHIAVGAGGVSALERCLVGVPSVVLSIADNQVEPARGLCEAGAALYLGSVEESSERAISTAITLLLESDELRRSLRSAGLRLVDGRGVERVSTHLLGSTRAITLRRAGADDADMVFPWRNAASTRRYIHDPRPLELPAHRAWFAARSADPDCDLLIASASEVPCGVLRFDISGARAEVSIYLDPSATGSGVGAAVLHAGSEWLARQRPNVSLIEATVLTGNDASARAFAAAGYRLHAGSHRLRLR